MYPLYEGTRHEEHKERRIEPPRVYQLKSLRLCAFALTVSHGHSWRLGVVAVCLMLTTWKAGYDGSIP